MREVRCGIAALGATIFALGCGGGPAPRDAPGEVRGRRNPIVEYLCGAELQAEDDGHLANIRQALSDMARLPVEQLRQRRYADYRGKPGAWDLPWLIQRHFVPASAAVSAAMTRSFWQSVGAEEVRALARMMLATLDTWNTGGPHGPPC